MVPAGVDTYTTTTWKRVPMSKTVIYADPDMNDEYAAGAWAAAQQANRRATRALRLATVLAVLMGLREYLPLVL